ncbi:TonB-dependent siderophore receptor [Flavobacterium sp. WLB]|uniref:TonB-dependent receptor n=1 Tax=unclassified Flavobacterium TaxID=196869 RepID=UPI0006ABE32A|nr:MULTISPECIES: TonB-dependent receptor [unclassified Flavobacterium]KOP37419.1 TonB-dependent receptor [Flavobacterium sp. VMW]OWU88387.1 TonB-dependent receptor [Flavobacterium sp. NLM]PUU72068.1 TonB-dependent siderophore receptor [Flavobacterium sp. WLB]
MKTTSKTLKNNVLTKVFLAFLIVFFCSEAAFSQSALGTISGKAILKDGNPLQGAVVKISELNKTTTTDSDGTYLLKNIPFGTYLVEIKLNGYESAPASVLVDQNNANPTLDFELAYTSQKLEEVIVSSGGNRFARKESEEVSKMKLKNMENPQVYSIVSKELMKEQVITDYNSAFKNIPGAGISEVRNQGRSTNISRGFVTPQLVRNGVGSFTYNSIDPSNLERIEVIKGPSATLFGSTISSFGGLFNRVTKKPFDFFKGEVSYSAGDWDLNRFTADINTPINDDKTALFRINTALHSERSFQDAGFNKSFFIAPSFSYQVNERLTLLIDAEFSASKGVSPMRLAPFTGAGATAHSIEEMEIPYKLSFANNTVNYTAQQYNIFAQLKYQISEEWTSQTIISRTRSSSEGYTVALTAMSNETLRQQVTNQDFPYYGTDIQQNFNGDFKIGNLRNRVVAGLDFYSVRATRNDATVNMPAVNFRTPGDAYNNFTIDKIKPLFAAATYTNYTSNNERTYSAYISDVLNITDRLIVMAGLRADRYINKGLYYPATNTTTGNYNQTAFSPRFGAVYQIVKDKISVFSNYMNGFNNVGGSDFNGDVFKPNHANQLEGGFKFDFSKISATLSYYNIEVTNITRNDPDHANFQIQDGTQLSKGFEAELIANPIKGLNIVAGYTYNDSRLSKSNPSTNGLRPTTAGSPTTANLWASYRLTQGAASGLGFGVGGIYGSKYFQTNTAAFKFQIPEYTVLDASVFYDRPKYRLGLKVDNLTNEKYWSYRLAAQNPTRVTGNITFKF